MEVAKRQYWFLFYSDKGPEVVEFHERSGFGTGSSQRPGCQERQRGLMNSEPPSSPLDWCRVSTQLGTIEAHTFGSGFSVCPSTAMIWPDTKRAASEPRNTAMAPISPAVTKERIEVPLA